MLLFFIIDIIYQINVYILGFFVYVDVYIYLIIKVYLLPLYKMLLAQLVIVSGRRAHSSVGSTVRLMWRKWHEYRWL